MRRDMEAKGIDPKQYIIHGTTTSEENNMTKKLSKTIQATQDNAEIPSMKPTTILRTFFNTSNDPEGYTKKPAVEFLAELKELDPADKAELADLAAEAMGVRVTIG